MTDDCFTIDEILDGIVAVSAPKKLLHVPGILYTWNNMQLGN